MYQSGLARRCLISHMTAAQKLDSRSRTLKRRSTMWSEGQSFLDCKKPKLTRWYILKEQPVILTQHKMTCHRENTAMTAGSTRMIHSIQGNQENKTRMSCWFNQPMVFNHMVLVTPRILGKCRFGEKNVMHAPIQWSMLCMLQFNVSMLKMFTGKYVLLALSCRSSSETDVLALWEHCQIHLRRTSVKRRLKLRSKRTSGPKQTGLPSNTWHEEPETPLVAPESSGQIECVTIRLCSKEPPRRSARDIRRRQSHKSPRLDGASTLLSKMKNMHLPHTEECKWSHADRKRQLKWHSRVHHCTLMMRKEWTPTRIRIRFCSSAG